ncbi:MAG: arsenic transporter, partial [Clostridia bacterium]|nr:arsenic transporter [Clostridia bacterium]
METLIIAIVLFAITYILLFALPKYKPYIALGSAIIFSLWLTLNREVDFTFATFIESIEFNVLMMITGTMGIVSFFIASKMPMRIADVMLSKFKNVKMAIVAMAVFAGVVSAFMDNVATVLIVAPIAFA